MAMDEKLDMQNAKITGVLEIVKKVCQCRSCLKALVRNLKNEDYVGTSTIPTTATLPALALMTDLPQQQVSQH